MTVRILVLAGLIPLTLGGCASHTHNLIQDGSDQDITVGTFRHEGPEGTAMFLELRGVRFEARAFAIERKQNLAELRRLYSTGKHYDRIFSGLDTDHYATLRCSAVWRSGGSPSGHCLAADDSRINFRFG